MGYKSIIFSCTLLFSLCVNANSLLYQIVEKEFSLTPDLISTIQKSPKNNPNSIYITLTDEGADNFNKFILNSYDKGLNVIFNGEVVTLSIPIKTYEMPKSFMLNTKDKQTTDKIFNYLTKK